VVKDCRELPAPITTAPCSVSFKKSLRENDIVVCIIALSKERKMKRILNFSLQFSVCAVSGFQWSDFHSEINKISA